MYCLGTYLFLTTVLVCNDNRMHSMFWLVMKYTVKMDYYNNNYWVLWQLLVTGSVAREELCHYDTMTHMSRKWLHDVNIHAMNCLRLALSALNTKALAHLPLHIRVKHNNLSAHPFQP